MGGGCLSGLARAVARTCLRVGAVLASITIRSLAFLLLNVVGPLCFGAAREALHQIVPKRWGGKGIEQPSLPQTQLGYALGFGSLWVVGYVALRAGLSLVSWIARLLLGYLAPGLPSSLGSLLVPALVFSVGALVGALAFRHEGEIYTGT